MTDGTRPIMQRCTFCGQDWWDSHSCTPPRELLEKLASQMPPFPPAPLPQGLRLPPSQLTEADVRRIVREEIERAMAVHLLRPLADPANPMTAGRT